MTPDLVHLLTPGADLRLSRVACDARDAQQASWVRALVTCPTCLAGTRPPDARQAPRLTPGRPLPGVQTEEQWLQQVLTLARSHHWLAYHTRNSQKSAPGWPDVALAKAGSPLYLIELKLNHGALSGHQQQWLETLRQTSGLVVDVWRPDDFATILEVLR